MYMFYQWVQICLLVLSLSLLTMLISEELPQQQNVIFFPQNIHATNTIIAKINAEEQVATYRLISYICISHSVERADHLQKAKIVEIMHITDNRNTSFPVY